MQFQPLRHVVEEDPPDRCSRIVLAVMFQDSAAAVYCVAPTVALSCVLHDVLQARVGVTFPVAECGFCGRMTVVLNR
jgi:hypothetical protein